MVKDMSLTQSRKDAKDLYGLIYNSLRLGGFA